MTKREREKMDMIFDMLRDHTKTSSQKHDTIIEKLDKHTEEIGILKERSDTNKGHIYKLYAIAVSALGIHPFN